jgi:hypothetical protein
MCDNAPDQSANQMPVHGVSHRPVRRSGTRPDPDRETLGSNLVCDWRGEIHRIL